MTQDKNTHHAARSGHAEFVSTRWSVVLAAGQASTPGSQQALAALCRDYWYPLYAYVRRRVNDAHEAQDLVQEFFARLVEKNVIAVADPQRGRFRSFLLASLRNFLSHEWAKAGAAKRGGRLASVSLDLDAGEARYLRELAENLTPEQLFERRWAETLLDRVTTQLRDEFARAGRKHHFDELKLFLTGKNPGASYAEAAANLGITEGAAMVAAHRMRRRFRELLMAEIAQTLANPQDIDDEINGLFAALAS